MISENFGNSENYDFLKIHKKSVISKMTSVSCRLGRLQSPVLESG